MRLNTLFSNHDRQIPYQVAETIERVRLIALGLGVGHGVCVTFYSSNLNYSVNFDLDAHGILKPACLTRLHK